MSNLMKEAFELLLEWGITNPTEQQMWEAIAEVDNHSKEYYEDGDLAEWL